jgi:DNA (cytosine-5)-methyltransferase 1
MGLGGHNVPFLLDNKGLRKLSEHECLKLQGFFDDYKIPSFEEMPRTKIYTMIGNSVSPRVSTLIGNMVFSYLDRQLNDNKLAV